MSFETPFGKFAFVKVANPAKKDGKDGETYNQYELTLLVRDNQNIAAIETAINEVIKDKFPKVPRARLFLPIKAVEDCVNKQGELYAGFEGFAQSIKFVSYKLPACFDMDRNEIPAEEVYSGCRGRVMAYAKDFSFKDDKGMTTQGVRLVILSVQKSAEGERISEGASAAAFSDEGDTDEDAAVKSAKDALYG